MFARIMRLFRDERGTSVIEYALILSLIAIVCLGGMNLLGPQAQQSLTSSATAITSAPAQNAGNDGNNDGGGNNGNNNGGGNNGRNNGGGNNGNNNGGGNNGNNNGGGHNGNKSGKG